MHVVNVFNACIEHTRMLQEVSIFSLKTLDENKTCCGGDLTCSLDIECLNI